MEENTTPTKSEIHKNIVDSILNDNKHIAIKTFSNAIQADIISSISLSSNSKNPIYIVSNNKEKEEAARFLDTSKIDIKSVYTLAKQFISPEDTLRGNYTGGEVAQLLGKDEATSWKAVKLLSVYCNSTNKQFQTSKEGAYLAKELYEKMREGKLEKTFSFCLKELQLNLLSKKYENMNHPIAIMSNFESKSPLIRSIFKTLPLDKKVLFWQNHKETSYLNKKIKNPFSEKDAPFWKMHTLRHTDEVSLLVAKKANAVLHHFMGEEDLIIGTNKDTRPKNGVLLSKTNVFMVDAAVKYAQQNIYFKMLKEPKKSFELPLAILKVEAGKRVSAKDYDYLQKEFASYTKEKKGSINFGEHITKKGKLENNSELVWAGEVARKYPIDLLKDTYEKAQQGYENTKEANYFVSTIHAIGERRFDYCSLAEDIEDPISIVAKYYAQKDTPPKKENFLKDFSQDYKENKDMNVIHRLNLFYSAVMSGTEDSLFSENMRDISLMSAEKIIDSIYDEYKNIVTKESKKKSNPSNLMRSKNKDVFKHDHFLTVEFEESGAAKALGAVWDADVKLWYAKAGRTKEHFKDFLPEAKEEKLALKQEKEKDISSFYHSAQELGLVIHDAPFFDGRFKRVDVEGGRRGGKEGSYIGYDGAIARGHMRNFKTGEERTWSSLDGGDWDNNELALIKLISKQRNQESAKETLRENKKNGQILLTEWNTSKNATATHPYLVKKQVGAYGLKMDAHGSLLMPLQDAKGTFWTMQRIGKDGFKQIGYKRSQEEIEKDLSFPTRKTGNFHLIGAKSLQDSPKFVVVEGYATGATIYEALDIPVIVAVDAGNLVPVVTSIKENFKNITLLIAGDNDQKNGPDKNVGEKKAIEAAKACDGKYVIPTVAKEEEKEVSDWNDIAIKYGIQKVKSEIISSLTQKKTISNNVEAREVPKERISCSP